ncbi:MAG: FHA domain-containing protein [Planctomycetes bacterium]|nr:FHA domain-containing protein [Planctomycetota bacterium]
MKITLTISKGEFAGKTFNVDKKAIIGRSPKTHICIDDELVSRKHAEIFVKTSMVYIKDLKSSGGTFVNSKVVLEPRKLKSRDKIRIANTIFEIKILKPKKSKEKASFISPKLGRTLSDIVKSDTEQIDVINDLAAPVLDSKAVKKHASPEPGKIDIYKNSRNTEAIQEQAIEVVTKYRSIKHSKQKFTLKGKLGFLTMYFDEMPFWMKSVFVVGIILFAILLFYFGFTLFDTEPPEIPDSDNTPIFIPDSNQKILWPPNSGYLSGLINSPFHPHNLIQTYTECFIIDYSDGKIIVKGNIELRNSKKLVVFPGATITNAYEGAEFIEVKDFNGDVCTLPYGITFEISDFGVFEPMTDNRDVVKEQLADYEKSLNELEKDVDASENDVKTE